MTLICFSTEIMSLTGLHKQSFSLYYQYIIPLEIKQQWKVIQTIEKRSFFARDKLKFDLTFL